MTNLEKYNHVFITTLEVKEEQLEDLEYDQIPEWGSVEQFNLITTIEDTFGIRLKSEDVIEFDSYKKGKEILHKKYGLEF